MIYIIIIIILTLFIIYSDQYEHYDLQILNISPSECGTTCTEGRNCSAFAYDPIENTCYLSKTGILGQPYSSLYADEYSRKNKICNKINRLTDTKRIDSITLVQNSVYLCSDNNMLSQYQYANYDETLLDGVTPDDNLIPKYVVYDLHDINWPIKKPDPNIIAPIPYSNNPN